MHRIIYWLLPLLLLSCKDEPPLLDLQLWGQWSDSTEQYYVHFRPETRDTAWVRLPGDSADYHLWKIEGQRIRMGAYTAEWTLDSPFGSLWLGELGLRLEQSRGIHPVMKLSVP